MQTMQNKKEEENENKKENINENQNQNETVTETTAPWCRTNVGGDGGVGEFCFVLFSR